MHEVHRPYVNLAGRQRVEKALATLRGLLAGVGADGLLLVQEAALLEDWIAEHRDVSGMHPFNEVFPMLTTALGDGELDPEERADVEWLCERLLGEGSYFDGATRDIQTLQGLLGGVAADGCISIEELDALGAWMDDRSHLKTMWPFDEVEALLTAARRDRRIDAQEHQSLLAFFSEFTRTGEHHAISPLELGVGEQVIGLCAVNPEITFEGRRFAFTGASERAKRRDLEALVRALGGTIDDVGRSLDYLVVGAEGNPCWAYSCYGRKVEQAVHLRRAGSRLLVVHETDFWDAAADAGFEPGRGVETPAFAPFDADGPGDLVALLSPLVGEMQGRGWHVELSAGSCGVHRRFKNGKPRRTPVVSLSYTPGRLDDSGQALEPGPNARPYSVHSPSLASARSFKDARKAAEVFLAEVRSHDAE